MTGPQIPSLGQRKPPPSSRGAARWLGSEWGIAILALVLAVLVWAVVWGRISYSPDEPLQVRLELKTSPDFAAFHEGTVPIVLEGPRSEIEEAIVKLGIPYTLLVNVPDLKSGVDREVIRITDTSQVSLPFPDRLVRPPIEARIEVFRIQEVQARFLEPKVAGIPPGVGYEVEITPHSRPIAGPATHVGSTIQPDPVDLSDLFADVEAGIVPLDTTRQLSFSKWRHDEAQRRYRGGVELPPVSATFRFFLEGRKSIYHRIEFKFQDPQDADKYVISTENEEVNVGYYTGQFEGALEDLEKLADKRDENAWWYVVTIPDEKLPAGDEEDKTDSFTIEFAHKQSIHDLRVRFLEGATLLVTVKRKP